MGNQHHRRSDTRRKLLAGCERGVDLCVLFCLFGVPLWFGGRHDLGRLIYAVAVAIATILWCVEFVSKGKTRLALTPLHGAWLAAAVLLVVQMLPLSPEALATLGPGIGKIAPAWTSGASYPVQLGEWRTLSVTPNATAVGFAVLLSHALLFFIVVERLRDLADIRRMLARIGAASACMAVFGLMQWLFSNGKLMWFYEHPQREIGEFVQGSFFNKNHFAHFVAIGLVPMLVSWRSPATRSHRSTRKGTSSVRGTLAKYAWPVAIVLSVAAVILSGSRGGVLACLAASGLAGAYSLRQSQLDRRQVISVATFAIAVLLVVSLGGVDYTFKRLAAFSEGSIEALDQHGSRREVWAANRRAFALNPWFGYGVGSHADVCHAFLSQGVEKEYEYAESGYLHTATETGSAGLALLFIAGATLAWWCCNAFLQESAPDRRLLWAAVGAGFAASAVHSIGDFVWYIPACTTLLVLLAACASRLHRLDLDKHSRRGSIGESIEGVLPKASVLAAGLAVALLLRPGLASLSWDRYLRASVRHREFVAEQLRRPDAVSNNGAAQGRLLHREMIAALEDVVSLYPGHARGQLRLAGRRLQAFELSRRTANNAIGLVHIRDAALASRFRSKQDTLDWLYRALGEDAEMVVAAHQEAAAALSLAPLQADGYGYLADLCFLAPLNQRDVEALVGQACRIRPFDGGTLFEAGKQAWVAGNAEQAVKYWKRAYTVPGPHRLQIGAQLATRIPLAALFEDFEPDWQLLDAVYRLRDLSGVITEDDLQTISRYATKVAEAPVQGRSDEKKRLRALVLTSEVYERLDEIDRSIQCARDAVDTISTSYEARRRLAAVLMEAGRSYEAGVHLRWCCARNPSDPAIQRWLRQTKWHEQQMSRDAKGSHERLHR